MDLMAVDRTAAAATTTTTEVLPSPTSLAMENTFLSMPEPKFAFDDLRTGREQKTHETNPVLFLQHNASLRKQLRSSSSLSSWWLWRRLWWRLRWRLWRSQKVERPIELLHCPSEQSLNFLKCFCTENQVQLQPLTNFHLAIEEPSALML